MSMFENSEKDKLYADMKEFVNNYSFTELFEIIVEVFEES